MNLLERIEHQLKTAQMSRAAAQKLTDAPLKMHLGSEGIVVEVRTLDELNAARQVLKNRLGTWEDRLDIIWFSCGKMLASYKTTQHPVAIWLQAPPEDFPSDLQSKKCRIIKTAPLVEERYAYVCEEEENE